MVSKAEGFRKVMIENLVDEIMKWFYGLLFNLSQRSFFNLFLA